MSDVEMARWGKALANDDLSSVGGDWMHVRQHRQKPSLVTSGSASFLKAHISSPARAPECDTSIGGLVRVSMCADGFSKFGLSLFGSPVRPSGRGINTPFLVQVQAISSTSLAHLNPIPLFVVASLVLIELRPLSAPLAR